MKDKKTTTTRCHECDTRGFKAYMIPISYLWFCSPCWAKHPWNPKEILGDPKVSS